MAAAGTGSRALIIGNSDGIGLAVTRHLLEQGREVAGFSRSPSPVEHPRYTHHQVDLLDPAYPELLGRWLEERGVPEVCLYCAGMGEPLDLGRMAGLEPDTFRVNLLGLVETAARVLPGMVRQGRGHLLGISSLADSLHSPEAPAYAASKAGFSLYLESLALAVRPRGVFVTNLRFGFVDTKMAKSLYRPFMMSRERAVREVMKCLRRRPVRHSVPRIMVLLVAVLRGLLKPRVLFPGRPLRRS